MRLVSVIVLLFMAFFSGVNESAGELLVHVGDSTATVRSHLGEPNIEFPLHGQLIQDYGYCVITSKDGVVVSIKERSDSSAPAKAKTQEDSAAPTMQSMLAKANAGDAEAQYCLAYCYHSGTPVKKDMDAALRWYTLAAMQGHVAAQHNLGLIYMRGEDAEQDYEQAYTWALLAAGNGNDSLLQALRGHVTREQMAAATSRASRILNGTEPSPYGLPDVAQKKSSDPAGSSSD